MDELQTMVEDEAKARAQASTTAHREAEVLRELLHGEEVSREEQEERLLRQVTDVRVSVQTTITQTNETMDGLKKEMRDARLSLDKEFREKMDEIRDMRNRVKDLAGSQSRIHAELKSSDEELREEQALEELARRMDEQTKAWHSEATKITRAVEDERTDRESGNEKLKLQMSKIQQNLEDEGAHRVTALHAMQAQVEQIEETVAQETKETVRTLDQLSDRVGSVRRALTDEQKERLAGDTELGSKIREVTQRLDAERQQRQADHTTAMLTIEDGLRSHSEAKTVGEGAIASLQEGLEKVGKDVAHTHEEIATVRKESDQHNSEVSKGIVALQEGLQLEQHGRLSSEHELGQALRELRSAFEKSSRTREQTEMKMSRLHAELKEQTDKDSKASEASASRLQSEVG